TSTTPATTRWNTPRRSADAEQLHFEHQRRVRRNHSARARLAVAQFRRNGELALSPDFHARHALVPALDHLPAPEREAERLPAVLGRIELLSVGEPARVVHADLLAFDGLGAGPDHHL